MRQKKTRGVAIETLERLATALGVKATVLIDYTLEQGRSREK